MLVGTGPGRGVDKAIRNYELLRRRITDESDSWVIEFVAGIRP